MISIRHQSVDLRQIRYFIAVAEELHFHNAARRIGVAQPALSRTIKTLEADLGTELFQRTNRKVILTPAGELMLREGQKILHLSERLVESLQASKSGKTGIIRLGYTENAINGALPSVLKKFQTKYPEIKLKLHHLGSANQFKSLDDETIDLGFVSASNVPSGYESICLQRERFICVVSEDHSLAVHDVTKLQDLESEPMVRGISSEWSNFHALLAPCFNSAGFEPKISHECLTTLGILRLVSCGLGIAILTESVMDTPIPGVKKLEIDGIEEQLITLAVWKTTSVSESNSVLVKFLKQAL